MPRKKRNLRAEIYQQKASCFRRTVEPVKRRVCEEQDQSET